MNIGACSGQETTIDDLQQGLNICYIWRPNKQHRQGIGDSRHSLKVPFSHPLCGITAFDLMYVSNHADNWL
jgi:hypothetical protein